MAVSAHFDCASASGLLPGSRMQESGILACQAVSGNGCWRTVEGVSQSMRSNWGSSMVSFSDRHTFGACLEHISAFHRRQQYRTQVRVAADYPDSKPDASSYLGDLGYHPLEDISSLEKKKSVDLTERRLTDAEVARTLAEANETAILFASLWEDQDHVFGTEVEYLIDEHGDFYFQIDDDSEFLTTLNSARTQMNVAIGYESIEDWILEQQEVHEEHAPEEPQDESSDEDEDEDDDEQEESWAIIAADGTEYVLEEVGEEQESSEESLGNWSGLDTLNSIHPLEFASALAAAALSDDNEKIDKPCQSLRIVGEVRRLNEEEEEYVKKLCEERFGREVDDEDEDEDDDESDEESTEEMEETGSEEDEDEEAAELSEARTSCYKLDIQSIHVVSYFRAESTVETSEFQAAKPDILARAGPEIIERLNAGGKVLEDALKLVCLHWKGLEVEEAALLHVDCLGMDLRVHCGREVKTLRVSFSQKATSVEHAEQLLNQLLFPEVPLKGRKKRKSWFQGKST